MFGLGVHVDAVRSTRKRRLLAFGQDPRSTLDPARARGLHRELAAETGAKAGTSAEAARAGEVVVLTIPQKAILDLPKDLFANVPKDVVVIDTGNYYPVRDGQIEELDGGKVESEWVASRIGRPVVKAFNNIFFKNLLEKGTAKGTPGRIALPVAGDPPEARAKVLRLVDELGFDPIDAGSLSESRLIHTEEAILTSPGQQASNVDELTPRILTAREPGPTLREVLYFNHRHRKENRGFTSRHDGLRGEPESGASGYSPRHRVAQCLRRGWLGVVPVRGADGGGRLCGRWREVRAEDRCHRWH